MDYESNSKSQYADAPVGGHSLRNPGPQRSEPSLTSVEDITSALIDQVDNLERTVYEALGYRDVTSTGVSADRAETGDRITALYERLDRTASRINSLNIRVRERLYS